ncbi:unnamed protein product [Discosporangium mesarthrocarpum]
MCVSNAPPLSLFHLQGSSLVEHPSRVRTTPLFFFVPRLWLGCGSRPLVSRRVVDGSAFCQDLFRGIIGPASGRLAPRGPPPVPGKAVGGGCLVEVQKSTPRSYHGLLAGKRSR